MKRYLVAIGALLVVASISVIAPVTMASQDQPAPKAAAKVFRGDVTAVDANQLTIKNDAGEQVVLAVVADTKIRKAGKDIKIADVKVGDSVTCDCDEAGGSPKAKSIEVKPKAPK